MLITLPQIINEKLNEAEFAAFCAEMRDYRIERTKDGLIEIIAPTYSETGKTNGEIFGQLWAWNRNSRSGYVFDSSTGFRMPDTAIKSADVAWVSNAQWNQLTDNERNSFAPICPEFVIELKSANDNLKKLQTKMQEWLDSGCQLAWLIAPETETCYTYRANGIQDIVVGFDNVLSGENVLPNFNLILAELR
jgi:Uma2 family endonuclease